ncbi:hypothetical protein M8J76_003621 [Diaphorina citri]|nr:hypothetical protein M8J75_013980 [Diaphorina citri]KAI5708352.1 hypothetical protein M8J77_021089 [Diaphorina citri]KAI5708801.1 hypothetical protein M8J76_003621 [Diaphorina citri]
MKQKMNTDQKEELIELLRERPPLWDMRSMHYKDVEVKRKLWIEVSQEMGMPIKELKTIWKSMRGLFCQQLRRELERPTPAPKGARRWSHFQSMLFLKDALSQEFFANTNSSETSLPVTSQSTSPEHQSYTEPPQFTSTLRYKRPRSTIVGERLADLENETISIIKESIGKTREDPDMEFLKSFHAIMKDMTPHQKLKFRAGMSNLALEVFENDTSNATQEVNQSNVITDDAAKHMDIVYYDE